MGKRCIAKRWLIVILCGWGLVACDSQKEPAEAAFAQVQASVAPVSADLEKYAPDEFAQLSTLIDDMKAKLNAKDYAAALTARTQVMAQLAVVSGRVGSRKNELTKQLAGEWKDLSSAVPALLSQLNSRLNYLQGGVKLPADVGINALQQATQAISELKIEWAAALNAMASRDADIAVNKAQAIKKRGAEVGAMLGIKPTA